MTSSKPHLDVTRADTDSDDYWLRVFFATVTRTGCHAAVIARHANNERQQELVRESARHMVRFKLQKFEGIYDAYA